MIGGIYCPLSPRDPQYRLNVLLQQIQCRLVLVHCLTKTKFNDNIILFDIHLVVTNNNIISKTDIDQLSNIIVIPNNIAYIIFTSGSTGNSKAVC